MMKVIVTGAAGQLGWELKKTVPESIELKAFDIDQLDITDAKQVKNLVEKEKPDWVINAAAYTAVDKAEDDVEQAYLINRDGAENIAHACKQVSAKMLHVSTDFVFDGTQGSPYLTTSQANPLNVYGASKLAGDEVVLQVLGDDCTIVRTSWVYSSHGYNFVKTMIRLMSEKPELGIVADQIGTPTWANGLAKAIWSFLKGNVTGIQHWSNYGVASWYDFALAIYEESVSLGFINNTCNIKPIRTDQYPLPAIRPQYSVLDKSNTVTLLDIEPEHWRISLREMLSEFKNQEY